MSGSTLDKYRMLPIGPRRGAAGSQGTCASSVRWTCRLRSGTEMQYSISPAVTFMWPTPGALMMKGEDDAGDLRGDATVTSKFSG